MGRFGSAVVRRAGQASFGGFAPGTPSPPAAPPTLPPAFEDIDDVPMPDPDLWQRIRKGFAMEPLDSQLVTENEAWYSSRPEYIARFVDRGSLYLHYIVEQVEKRNMPMEIALLPVIESAFNPKAYSRAKASGIWQFIPSTGKNYGLSQDWWKDNRRDIVAATDAALTTCSDCMGCSTAGSWRSRRTTPAKEPWRGRSRTTRRRGCRRTSSASARAFARRRATTSRS
jgi:hypothetical protein